MMIIGFLGTFFSGLSLILTLKDKLFAKKLVEKLNILLTELERSKTIHNCYEKLFYDKFKPFYEKYKADENGREMDVNQIEKIDYENLWREYNYLYLDEEMEPALKVSSRYLKQKEVAENDIKIIEKLSLSNKIVTINDQFPKMIQTAMTIHRQFSIFNSQLQRRNEQAIDTMEGLYDDISHTLRYADSSMKAIIDVTHSITRYLNTGL